MSLTHFQVYFDDRRAVYMGGQQVTGHVVVRIAREKRVRGIEIKLRGQADVEWSESRSTTNSEGQSETVTDYYSAKETYFKQKSYVVGGPNADITLAPGEYVYPFSLILPVNIPSSFESQYGHVRYIVECTIDRPWRFDHKCKAAFTVVSLLDLNREPQYQEVFQQAKEKVMGCWCCRHPPISVVATLPSRGFVPGQRCSVAIEVDNPTTKVVTAKCLLVQTITYTSRCKRTKECQSEKVVNRLGSIEQRQSRTWTTDIEIPPLPASHLQHCSCIDISYSIVVKGVPTGLHRDITVKIPIVIGSIPYRTHFASIAPSAPLEDNENNAHLPPDSPLSIYPDIPPPSYEECVSGKVNIREKDDNEYVRGDLNFSPSYPVYHFTSKN